MVSANRRSSGRAARKLVSSTPQDRDVVVTCEDAGLGRYTIRQLPACDQVVTSLREDAIDLARRFAEAHAVDVWLGAQGGPQLLVANRPVAEIWASGTGRTKQVGRDER